MNQLFVLYELIQKDKLREIEVQASLHGVKIKRSFNDSTGQAEENPDVPLFRDPSDYETMSETEREEETQRMMGLHKRWSGDALNKKPEV